MVFSFYSQFSDTKKNQLKAETGLINTFIIGMRITCSEA